MRWYVIQTYTGREEKLIEMIRRIVPGDLYGECFVVYHEQLRSRGKENQIHIERSFPGYAFITSEQPEQLFLHLRRVPAMSKMMTAGEFYFTPLEETEAGFLSRILDADHIVRLSYAATDGRDHVTYVSGPLAGCGERILEYQFRKRYAAVRLYLAGQEKTVRLGIILNDDIHREITYGKVESPAATLECAERIAGLLASKKAAATANTCFPGDTVVVIDGAFEGVLAKVCEVKSGSVRLHVHLFDRDLLAEIPADSVRKTG